MPILDKNYFIFVPITINVLIEFFLLRAHQLLIFYFCCFVWFGALWIFPFSFHNSVLALAFTFAVRVNQISCESSLYLLNLHENRGHVLILASCVLLEIWTTRKSKTKATPLEIILYCVRSIGCLMLLLLFRWCTSFNFSYLAFASKPIFELSSQNSNRASDMNNSCLLCTSPESYFLICIILNQVT